MWSPANASLPYARVDLVCTDDGHAVVLELELTEPSLFLPRAPGAGQRFAAAVRTVLRSGGGVADTAAAEN